MCAFKMCNFMTEMRDTGNEQQHSVCTALEVECDSFLYRIMCSCYKYQDTSLRLCDPACFVVGELLCDLNSADLLRLE